MNVPDDLNFTKQRSNQLEPHCCKKQSKSPCQDTDLGKREPLKALNDTKLILNV